MRNILLVTTISLFFGCSKDDDVLDCCQTIFKDGVEYNIEQCDQATLERIREFGTHKELGLMQESSNCD